MTQQAIAPQNGKRKPQAVRLDAAQWDLNSPLLMLSPYDPWTIRDACEGVQIFGSIGSGKTSGSGAAIAQAFLRAGFGGLVMCAKPEERLLWEAYMRETGRTPHLRIIHPGGPHVFNFLDYEMRREGGGGGITENLVELMSHITDIVEGKQEQAGGEKFWERSMKTMLRSAIDLLGIARGAVTLEAIRELVASAPQSEEEVNDEHWQHASLCAQLINDAQNRALTPRQANDFRVAARYWLKEHARLADRTRTGIEATFVSTVDMLQHGIAWELLSTGTTIVPEATYRDGIVMLLDLPVQEYHHLGRIVQGIVKYMFQRAILRRDAARDPRPVFLWADEAQNFVSSFDYKYQAVARSARACTVYLTQNISNYYAVLGARGKDETNSLVGNFQTKIFHAQSDHATNQYAADLIAQHYRTLQNYSASRNDGKATVSAGGSQNLQYKVLPGEFTTLRKGGPQNNLEVDGILFQGGRIWRATGDTWMRATFRQG